jgi:hypothetical protein
VELKSETLTKDQGAQHILRQLEKIGNGVSITTGIHSPEGSMLPRYGGGVDGKVPIAQYAFWNEYGNRKAKIPARPTFRPTVKMKKELFLLQTSLLIKRVHRGASVKAVLKLQGKRTRIWLKAAIWNKSSPANAPYTLFSKKKRGRGSNPLIDSGSMHNSITSKSQYPGGGNRKVLRNGLVKINNMVRRMKP